MYKLIEEQLQEYYIEPHFSPWDTSISCIPESGEWFPCSPLCQCSSHYFDALQSGISSPAMVTQNYHIIVIDLQDHITITLHPSNKCVLFQDLLLNNQALTSCFQSASPRYNQQPHLLTMLGNTAICDKRQK